MPTVGLEIEIAGLSRSALNCINFLRYEVHDDGSIRGDTFTVDGMPLLFTQRDHSRTRGSGGPLIIPSGCGEWRDSRIGLEMVTSPYPHLELIPLADRVGKLLGHIPQTAFTSIHMHVDVGNKSWRYVQSVLAWFYWLEAAMYRMSAGGVGIHRGERVTADGFTDYRYCRPLSDPIGVAWDGRKPTALILLDAMLSAKTASQFVASWGRLDLYWGRGDDVATLGHYVPHRLHGVNLASTLRLGTLELRLFDGVYSKLAKFIQIAVALFQLAEDVPDPRSVNPGFDQPLVLGKKYDNVTADTISSLIGVDVSDVWGSAWPTGTATKHRPSHYQAMSMPTFGNTPQRVITNNAGTRDDGTDNFVLYVRR